MTPRTDNSASRSCPTTSFRTAASDSISTRQSSRFRPTNRTGTPSAFGETLGTLALRGRLGREIELDQSPRRWAASRPLRV